MFGPRRLVVGVAMCGCLLLAALPAGAQQNAAPQLVAQSVSPLSGYYGACGDDMPVGVTIRADATSPLSLTVTLSYQYVSANPQIPSSPVLQARMPLFAAGTYAAAIDISDQAPAYLKGSDGSLQFQIEAKDAKGVVAQSGPGNVGIRHCPTPNSVAAQAPTVKAGR